METKPDGDGKSRFAEFSEAMLKEHDGRDTRRERFALAVFTVLIRRDASSVPKYRDLALEAVEAADELALMLDSRPQSAELPARVV